MKTRPFSGKQTKNTSLLALLFLSLISSLGAQEVTQLISSKLEVVDEQDLQMIDCNTYQFGDQILYDNPNALRLYENGAYRFDFHFSYFPAAGSIITPKNYLGKFYSVQIPESAKNNYRITAISPSNDKLSIYAIATGKTGVKDTFSIRLLDEKARLLADAIYPFEVHSYDPSTTTTVFMPMKMEFKPIYITLEDADNPGNRIERQILPFSPDTINVDANEAFNLLTEIEQQVYLNNQAYVLVADHERDYGYQASFRWEGPGLQYKPGSENGLLSYMTIKPGGAAGPPQRIDIQTILAADLQKAGLDQKGKRVQQTYDFVAPNVELKKIYNMSYIREKPGVIRSRTDQKALQHILQTNLPKAQLELRNADRQILKYYAPENKPKMEMQKAETYKTQSPAIRTSPDMTRSKAQQETTRTASPAISQKARVAQPNQQVVVTRPRYEVARPAEENPPKSSYYTLVIELSRETDVLSHQTYLLTFRVIE